ncbi:MAG: hypothetical protein H6553_00785 [Chitinophagales bacterium]|nr:hypothetical protein [Chitinophagales bacterium]
MKIFQKIFLILLSLFSFQCWRGTNTNATKNENFSAKRVAPVVVNPIVVNGIEYSVAINKVIASNPKTRAIYWKKEIYPIHYVEDLERDVQDIHIDSLYLRDTVLIIRNENKQFFELNLENQKVLLIKK